jgi:Branched-chain amino acid transport protein (AzlD)
LIWAAIILGSLGCYVLKLAGYLVPTELLERPLIRAVAGLLPIALLSSLVVVQTAAAGTALVVDARLAGLLVAIVALTLRAPFLLVVIAAAVTAAGVRALGLSA